MPCPTPSWSLTIPQLPDDLVEARHFVLDLFPCLLLLEGPMRGRLSLDQSCAGLPKQVHEVIVLQVILEKLGDVLLPPAFAVSPFLLLLVDVQIHRVERERI